MKLSCSLLKNNNNMQNNALASLISVFLHSGHSVVTFFFLGSYVSLFKTYSENLNFFTWFYLIFNLIFFLTEKEQANTLYQNINLVEPRLIQPYEHVIKNFIREIKTSEHRNETWLLQ